ncbi:MAG: fatty acid desaturase [Candidatus Binatia bacterium]
MSKFATSDYPENTAQATQANEFAELKRLVEGCGLLDKQPAYYTFKILLTLGTFGLGFALLLILDNFALQLLVAVFLAFAYCQVGFVGHDAGHHAIFRSPRLNVMAGLVVNLLISLSQTWWVKQHNLHHRYPNDNELDPHVRLPVYAFSQEAALKKQGLLRFIVGYQAFYFLPFTLLEGLGIRVAGIQYLVQARNVKAFLVDSSLMVLHFGLYFGLLFYIFSPWQVLAFTLVHQLLFGLYFGLVFAPNHKGMLIPDKNNPLSYLNNQVLTTHNVKPNPFVDFWYGGLNYQIEHHLFTTMPRNNFGKARKIIKPFCERHGISYSEAGTLMSFQKILTYLHRVSAPLRSSPAAAKKAT